jgi:hypothetical protein
VKAIRLGGLRRDENFDVAVAPVAEDATDRGVRRGVSEADESKRCRFVACAPHRVEQRAGRNTLKDRRRELLSDLRGREAFKAAVERGHRPAHRRAGRGRRERDSRLREVQRRDRRTVEARLPRGVVDKVPVGAGVAHRREAEADDLKALKEQNRDGGEKEESERKLAA